VRKTRRVAFRFLLATPWPVAPVAVMVAYFSFGVLAERAMSLGDVEWMLTRTYLLDGMVLMCVVLVAIVWLLLRHRGRAGDGPGLALLLAAWGVVARSGARGVVFGVWTWVALADPTDPPGPEPLPARVLALFRACDALAIAASVLGVGFGIVLTCRAWARDPDARVRLGLPARPRAPGGARGAPGSSPDASAGRSR